MVKDWDKLEKQELVKWLKGLLHERVVKITFEKKDGSLREMNATLNESLVISYEKKTDREKKVNEEIIPVFDTDKQEWRSFKVDSIKNIEFAL